MKAIKPKTGFKPVFGFTGLHRNLNLNLNPIFKNRKLVCQKTGINIPN